MRAGGWPAWTVEHFAATSLLTPSHQHQERQTAELAVDKVGMRGGPHGAGASLWNWLGKSREGWVTLQRLWRLQTVAPPQVLEPDMCWPKARTRDRGLCEQPYCMSEASWLRLKGLFQSLED